MFKIAIKSLNGSVSYIDNDPTKKTTPYPRCAQVFLDLPNAQKIADKYPNAYLVHSVGLKSIGSHYSIEEIIETNKRAYMHFFEPATLRFFNSRVGSDVFSGPGGIFFITSERFNRESRRMYTVRQFDPCTGDVSTVKGFQKFLSRNAALRTAESISK